jgi:hypothetical protein
MNQATKRIEDAVRDTVWAHEKLMYVRRFEKRGAFGDPSRLEFSPVRTAAEKFAAAIVAALNVAAEEGARMAVEQIYEERPWCSSR